VVNLKKRIKDVDINYIQYGKGEDIVLLHGWGQNIEMMKPLGNAFEQNHKITILDFPGFGESDEPKEPWTTKDYAIMLSEFLDELKISCPIIMGHSFGGRVAIMYAANHPVKKLVLFGSPCVKEEKPLSMKQKLYKKLYQIKFLAPLGDKMKKHLGSTDYKNASNIMRDTLVNVVNYDLSKEAMEVFAPTLLIWGELDTEAPVSDAKKLEQLLPDAGLIVLPNASHYAYLENLSYVTKILEEFL